MTRSTMVAAMAVMLAAPGFQSGGPPCMAKEITFIEDFALAKDRTEALKQLIPGTEDYYYYHCLHYQNAGQLDKVDETLKLWIERHGRTGRVDEIENRQALLNYEKNPKASLDFLQTRLNLHFNHQKETLDQKVSLPTSLDQNVINRETLTQTAFARHPGTLDGFEDAALDWLAGMTLSGDQRRHLLSRLQRPDHANLPKIVLDDLKYKNSGGFGQHPIHGQLLLSQLDELLKLEPPLLNQTNFVHAYLSKLQPGPDCDWRHDAKERQAYLDRLWEFVSRLAPVHNSVKAHVLYHRLVHDRALGVYDKDRFLTYIKLPRSVSYINPKYLERRENRDFPADLNYDCRGATLLPPIGNDEPLVRSFLMHFFVEEDSYQPYIEYINDLYLKDCFAETKIVNGLGDMEKWYSLLTPERYQQLKERIDLDFAEQNKTVFGPADDVSLDVYVKNVKTLLVKVYQINAANYYRSTLREVDTDINLDGLVANEEKTYDYDDPPLRRIRRTFPLPTLKERGTYIVEFIGGGKSSRALVRKGKLRYLVRTGTAGHVFTILDEANKKVPDAKVWLAGHEYGTEPGAAVGAASTAPVTQSQPATSPGGAAGRGDGTITVPFSNAPGAQPIILMQGELASLDSFQHQSENYSLVAGFHVEREALLKRKKATVIVRPAFYLNGTPVTLSVLEDVALVITSVDQEGVSTSKEVGDFKLFEDRESTYEFQAPENLARIGFLLKAKVQNLSQNKKVDLSAAGEFSLNNIDRTDKVEDLHLNHIDGQYLLDVLGKTGEAKASRPVRVELKHRDFRDTVHASLQTDKQGRAVLGALKDIAWVRATGPENTSHQWHMVKDQHSYPGNVHGKAGEAIHLPYMGTLKEPVAAEFSLLEVRGGTFVKDRFDALKIKDGFLVIQDLPAGDYDLLIKALGVQVHVRLTDGAPGEGYILAENRYLQTRNTRPLQIVSVEADRDAVRITLANASKFARVHLAATRFMPEYPINSDLGGIAFAEPSLVTVPKLESLYLSGRNIGDEYRYILDRKYARKFPGNMLTRPSLLLNPWAIRKTETAQQAAAEGEAYRAVGGEAKGERTVDFGKRTGAPAEGNFANLDFLSEQAILLMNLRADEKGVVTVNRKDLGAHQQLHVLAVDPENTAYRELSLPELKMEFNDLRLRDGLDPKLHFTEQKQISIVAKKQDFVLADISTSRFEAYDNLGKVYALYVTLSKDPTLVEFNFILRWPTMKPEQKQELYSKYACHELNFFLFRKDPDFFAKVVQPYLRNKKDKTFLDRWLIGDDLSPYLKPWAHAQLNTVERILLAQRIKDEQAATARHVKDLYDLIPPDIERFNFLFKTAIKGSALETKDAFGLLRAQEELKPADKLASMLARVEEPGRPVEGKSGRLAQRGEAAAGPAPSAAPATQPAAPGKPPADLAKKLRKDGEKEEAAKDMDRPEEREKGFGDYKYFEDAAGKRQAARQFYRRLDKTEEWVENNYYHLPIEAQNAALIPVNAFWKDYGRHEGKGEFFSPSLAEASRNFPEMMFALAVLDLPFEPEKHQTDFKGARLTLNAGSPMVVFHKEIKQAKPAEQKTPILVSQNFFRHNDRYIFVDNERMDKYVTDEFLIHTVYGCQVVITNPTSSPQKLDILLQVPRGSMPVANTQQTRSVHVDLQPYNTQTIEYFFYFPFPGDYVHYPVHVARNETLIAFCEPVTLKAVEKLSKIDKTAWDYISQNGTDEEVLEYLRQQNVNRIGLDRIAFRMHDKAYFNAVTSLLEKRHVYNHTLWSYAIRHNEPIAVREFLQHCDDFVNRCGAYIDSVLLTIDPVIRKSYQHMEYSPLVNARAHKLGKQRTILNDRFYEQYHRLMKVLSYRARLDDDDLMAVTYYLLLQDRVEEGQGFFARVDPKKLPTRIQHDYFTAYIDFYSDEHKLARGIASKYADYPVDRWRKLFANVLSQLDEVEGKGPKVVDTESREQLQANLAATEPTFELKVEAGQVTLNYQNLSACRVNYYLMDIELLFSRNPFVQQYSGQFSFIRPNETQALPLDAKKTSLTFDLPQRFHSRNVMVEIEAGGVKKSQAYYSHSLALQVVENYGQVKVTHEKTGKELPKVYVKVYARMHDGRVRFYKDGYTDLRGRFDYTSLNTNELDPSGGAGVEKFSLLVLSEADGAVVREANPPKQ